MRRMGDDQSEVMQRFFFYPKFRITDGIALDNLTALLPVQDQVYLCEGACGFEAFLPV